MLSLLRKNLSTIVLLVILGIVVFNPEAKALLLKGLLSTGVFNASTQKELPGKNSAALANLSFAGTDGQLINTTSLNGQVVFINFWATWCPPCIAEMGAINSLYKQLKNDPRVVFIMVDADSNLPLATAFMKKHGYHLPVYRLTAQLPADLFSGTLPTTLIIDSKGMLVKKHEGIANYDTKAMQEFIREL